MLLSPTLFNFALEYAQEGPRIWERIDIKWNTSTPGLRWRCWYVGWT